VIGGNLLTNWISKNMDLFGGAVTVTLPKKFSDCSTLRDVPDNQEMWASFDTQ
jgi:hypothetical protein